MRRFDYKQVREALDFAEEGGQALHVWEPGGARAAFRNAPGVFKRTKRWAHLIDADEARLIATAKRLGVRKIVVSRRGVRGQHIDLCGKPLERAITESEAK